MPHTKNDRIVESATEARAGVTGHNVRYVLLIGTLLVIVLFAIAYVVTGPDNFLLLRPFAPGISPALFVLQSAAFSSRTALALIAVPARCVG
jgi:hypothetical protein